MCMGWLRLVGSIKLQVSLVKEPYKRGDILQKRPVILRSLLIIAAPYVNMYVKSDAIAETQAESLRLAVQCMTEYMYVNIYVNMCKRALYLPKRDLRLR